MRFIYFLKKKRFYIFILLAIIVYYFTNSYFDSSVMSYVGVQTKAYFENLINNTIKTEVLTSFEGELITVKEDSEGNVSYAYMDAHKALSIRNKASIKLDELVQDINEKEKITNMEIPLGYFFTKIYFFSNGLKVPVKLKVYQAHDVTIDTTVTEYGINSTLFEVHLLISLDTYIQIPFQRQRQNLTADILLSVQIINSIVPNFYAFNS